MRLIYTKPKLKDLSQGSRIAFARQFRLLSQDDLSDRLGLTGECKRRTVTRYEKGNRNPKEERTLEISQILNININSIKKYNYSNVEDIIYTFMWLEELIPNYNIDLSNVPNLNEKYIIRIRKFIEEWNIIRNKRLKREISYEEYIEWKLNYDNKGGFDENE
ncbi:MAG: helix-turn-helix transcriptional regulator [Bacilli bacterium]|nr:helix-turn-helix transcriptional regulator [Bacilli bacterium]